MKHFPKLIYTSIIVSVMVTIVLWLSQIAINNSWYPTDSLTKYTILFKYIGKATALVTTILICWSFFLNPRFVWTKKFFANSQQVIETNMFVTRWAFIFMFVDPIFLAVNRLPNVPLFINFFGFRFTSGLYGIGHNLGLITIILIVFITIMLRQKWLDATVRVIFRSFFGLLPFLLITHIFFVKSDISKFLPLTIWVYGWLVFAIMAFLLQTYRQFTMKI
jgi:hypothetical protein